MSISTCITDYIDKNYKSYITKNNTNNSPYSPFFVYISGPQGSGKSYTTHKLHAYYTARNINVIAVSIDDFYLNHREQMVLNEQSDNPLINQGRGLPGTHDLKKLRDFMHQCMCYNTTTSMVHVPQYDKSKYNGEGDRIDDILVMRPGSDTLQVKTNGVVLYDTLDMVLIEGWFIGYEPVRRENIVNDKYMVEINENLRQYSDILWDNPKLFSDNVNEACIIVFKTNSDIVSTVEKWRIQQEHDLKLKNGGADKIDFGN
ncbi:putative ATP-dependent kinase SCDLUD_004466 [Saccharomycodes ludwigii]|uniref:putative ATP-dependent kinase n=1 Tax=Saccharomycodes ludwigii TaxID=36035 RepID=UPI001E87F469|nr:hypothetical protein SCDLUD_004466 [Saccharomycodes ludwigii]KAH3899044.1 hypothetical protein SCDLUD_004466 [Saccharomycodes ludwigii]